MKLDFAFSVGTKNTTSIKHRKVSVMGKLLKKSVFHVDKVKDVFNDP